MIKDFFSFWKHAWTERLKLKISCLAALHHTLIFQASLAEVCAFLNNNKKTVMCLKKPVLQNKSVPEAALTHPGISHWHTNRHLQTRCCQIMCKWAVCLPLTHTLSRPHRYTDAARAAAVSIRSPIGPVIATRHLHRSHIRVNWCVMIKRLHAKCIHFPHPQHM